MEIGQWKMDDAEVSPVRPYLWMGEDQDCHVNDFERIESQQRDLDYLRAAMNTPNSIIDIARLQNVQSMTLGGQMYSAQLHSQHAFTDAFDSLKQGLGAIGGALLR